MRQLLLWATGASLAAAVPMQNVTGAYHSNWDDVRLVQHGTQISGSYVCCGGGTIHGTIDGNVIHYRWRQPGGEGHGVWVIEPPDHLSGTWGAGADASCRAK